jgi:hypothetical protein
VRNGLKNATGTPLERIGHVLGPGIYFARNSLTSWGYSHPSDNNYKGSCLGKQLQMISLCEVASVTEVEAGSSILHRTPSGNHMTSIRLVGGLRDHGVAHTLTMESACIVRFLMVGGSFSVDVMNNPPSRVPTLRDVLDWQASKSGK